MGICQVGETSRLHVEEIVVKEIIIENYFICVMLIGLISNFIARVAILPVEISRIQKSVEVSTILSGEE
jgi:hypothetical protein